MTTETKQTPKQYVDSIKKEYDDSHSITDYRRCPYCKNNIYFNTKKNIYKCRDCNVEIEQ